VPAALHRARQGAAISPSRNSTSGPPSRQGKIRWRRFAVILIPSLGAVTALMVLTAEGALAASFSISGQQFQVSADSLQGTGFQQFGTIDQEASGTPVDASDSGQ
jgi:hypothetical protein